VQQTQWTQLTLATQRQSARIEAVSILASLQVACVALRWVETIGFVCRTSSWSLSGDVGSGSQSSVDGDDVHVDIVRLADVWQ